MTAILLVSSFRLATISPLKYLYASFKTGSFLKVTMTGYIHGVEIYGAIAIQVTKILKPIDESVNGLY